MQTTNIQIQTVLYGNSKEDIIRSAKSLHDGAVYAYSRGEITSVTLFYGDAYKTPLFTQEEIEELNLGFNKIFNLKYTFFNENTGSAKGQNNLARECFADYLFIINPDIVVAKDVFIRLLKPFEDESTGISECKQLPVEHRKRYNLKTMETSWSMGACTFIKRSIFDDLSGYDSQSFFMYGDDVDLAWRVRLLGFKVIYVPSALVYHGKTLDINGYTHSSDFAVTDATLAALIMRYKWDRPDLLKNQIEAYKHTGEEKYLKGVESFYKRMEENKLPSPIKNARHIADFDCV